jgi:hypothetical protein
VRINEGMVRFQEKFARDLEGLAHRPARSAADAPEAPDPTVIPTENPGA